MKNIFVFSIALLLVLTSCEQETITTKEYRSVATLNDNAKWLATSCWFNKNSTSEKVHITLEQYNDRNELREKINLSGFNLQLGIISGDVNLTASFFTFTADGDAITEYYDLFEYDTMENFIHIDWISDDEKEMTGSYELAFVISENSPSKFDESRPDTLLFTNGKFRALGWE